MFFVLWWLHFGEGGKGEVPQITVVIFLFPLFLLVSVVYYFFLAGRRGGRRGKETVEKLKVEGNCIEHRTNAYISIVGNKYNPDLPSS